MVVPLAGDIYPCELLRRILYNASIGPSYVVIMEALYPLKREWLQRILCESNLYGVVDCNNEACNYVHLASYFCMLFSEALNAPIHFLAPVSGEGIRYTKESVFTEGQCAA